MTHLEHTTWLLDARVSLFGRKKTELIQMKGLDDLATLFPSHRDFLSQQSEVPPDVFQPKPCVPAYVFQLETDHAYYGDKFRTVFAPTIMHRTLFSDAAAKLSDVENDVLAYMTLCAPGMRSVPDIIGRGFGVFENAAMSSDTSQKAIFYTASEIPYHFNHDALHAFAREHNTWKLTAYWYGNRYLKEIEP